MKEITKTETIYQCEKCKADYSSKAEAKKCEAKAISQDKGVKVGDIVMITQGDGKGLKAKVESVYVIDKSWGHYAWERYWHTIALTAKIVDSWGSRLLTFDSYETLKATKN